MVKWGVTHVDSALCTRTPRSNSLTYNISSSLLDIGQQLIDIFEFPIKLVLSPFTLAFDIVGSAPRGFGVPELISKLSSASIFAIATLGIYDIALEMGKKVICQRNCQTCNG
ncbi:uncharacterized protein LOC133701749 [Populus nigra]|uniref:uncharacterized protein LOC133701749 n=1 Tax=Populus nigra TaxID=3691 RepID=UPI002B278DF5|nr:uncharacterized protein LOC133701749 [Populus nigra]